MIEDEAGGGTGRAPSGRGRTAVLVTGMHRSGTSALARTLSLLGAALPRDLVDPNEGNPRGHWEPRDMVDLNDRMLAAAGSDLYGVVDVEPDWFGSPRAEDFVGEAAELASRCFVDDPLVVLKDPRTALMLPLWHAALDRAGFRVVHVLPLRHPGEVAESLRRRHLKTIPYDAWAHPRGEALWLRYTLAGVRGSRGHDRAFVRYADLLRDWRGEVARIGRETGVEWPAWGVAGPAVDAFLHGNDRAEGAAAPAGPDVSGGNASGLARLASDLHDVLVARGDARDEVDALDAEFVRRIGGARDLIGAFEDLYPLVWHHYEAGAVASARLEAALAAEDEMRASTQRLWAAMTASDREVMMLRRDLRARVEQIASLEAAAARPPAPVPEVAAPAAAVDHPPSLPAEPAIPDALPAAPIPPDPDRERLVAELMAVRDEADRAAALHLARNRAFRAERDAQARCEAERDLARAGAEIAALRRSASWRVTAPLRVASRLVRGRPWRF